MPALDTSRYRLEPPLANKKHDLGAWKACVDNAHSQLEHQYLRIMNLELMLKFGDKVRGGLIEDGEIRGHFGRQSEGKIWGDVWLCKERLHKCSISVLPINCILLPLMRT